MTNSKSNLLQILLVEENSIQRRIMGNVLRGLEVDVTDAPNGQEAIELIQAFEYDIILIDVVMTGMDGYETTKKIRKLNGVKEDLPIIAITSDTNDETYTKITEVGMNGIVSKPLRKTEVENILKEFGSNTESTDKNFFDVKDFEKSYEDLDLRKEIIDMFLTEKASDLSRIDKAYRSNDCKKIDSAVHYMKGTFSYLKAREIHTLSQKIVDLARSNKLDEIKKLEEPLLEKLEKLYVILTNYRKTI